MLKEDIQEIVAFDVDTIKFMRQMRKKYHGTRIGLLCDVAIQGLEAEIKSMTKEYRSVYGEPLKVYILEDIL